MFASSASDAASSACGVGALASAARASSSASCGIARHLGLGLGGERLRARRRLRADRVVAADEREHEQARAAIVRSPAPATSARRRRRFATCWRRCVRADSSTRRVEEVPLGLVQQARRSRSPIRARRRVACRGRGRRARGPPLPTGAPHRRGAGAGGSPSRSSSSQRRKRRPATDQHLVRDLRGALVERHQARLREPLEQRACTSRREVPCGTSSSMLHPPARVLHAVAQLGQAQEDVPQQRPVGLRRRVDDGVGGLRHRRADAAALLGRPRPSACGRRVAPTSPAARATSAAARPVLPRRRAARGRRGPARAAAPPGGPVRRSPDGGPRRSSGPSSTWLLARPRSRAARPRSSRRRSRPSPRSRRRPAGQQGVDEARSPLGVVGTACRAPRTGRRRAARSCLASRSSGGSAPGVIRRAERAHATSPASTAAITPAREQRGFPAPGRADDREQPPRRDAREHIAHDLPRGRRTAGGRRGSNASRPR